MWAELVGETLTQLYFPQPEVGGVWGRVARSKVSPLLDGDHGNVWPGVTDGDDY